MFDNAETFNLEGSEIHNDSLQLRAAFEQAIGAVESEEQVNSPDSNHY